MMMKSAIVTLMGLAIAAEAGTVNAHYRSPILEVRQNKGGNNNNNNNNNANANGSGANCLLPNVIQAASAQTGQVNGVAADGQSASATDKDNFINFCNGKTLTNGAQVTGGSCNGIPMGNIPAKTAMVSTVITNPLNNQNIAANQQFNVTLQVANLVAGSFTNATNTYFAAPQDVKGGKCVGHVHVTIQDTGKSINPTTPLDATTFAFFKGINDAGNGNGGLQAEVTGGLPAGNYRVCTMSSSSNHVPVIMPVAQRGAQDDCRYFTVGGNANNAAAANTGANNGGNANNAAAASKGAAAGSAGNKGNTSGAQSSGTGNSATSATQATAASKTDATKAPSAAPQASSAAASTGNKASSGGAIGGVAAPVVADSGDSTRPFSVNGDSFVNKSAAVQRACAIQNNGCADAVNSGKAQGSTVADCNAQETACNAAGGA